MALAFWPWLAGSKPWYVSRCSLFARKLWVVRVEGDDRELRPWHCIYVYNIEETQRSGAHLVLSSVLACASAILCTGGVDVIRKEAWPFCRTIPVSAYVGSSKNLKDLKVMICSSTCVHGHKEASMYSSTSLTRKRTPLGTYLRHMPRALGGS